MKRLLLALIIVLITISALPDKHLNTNMPYMMWRALAVSCTSPCIQAKGGNNATTGDTVAVTLDTNVTAANLLVADVFYCASMGCSVDTANLTMTVTDDHAHTFSRAIETNATPISGSSQDSYLGTHYQANATAGATVVTATASNSQGGAQTYYLILNVYEYTNVATSSVLNVTATGNNTGTNPTATTASACPTGTCIVHGAVFLDSGTQPSPGSGFTESLFTVNVDGEYKTVSSPGAVTVNWTAASDRWIVNATVWNPNGGAAPTTRQLLLTGVGK